MNLRFAFATAISRREFLPIALAAGVSGSVPRLARSQEEMQRFRWRVPAPKQDLIEETLVFDGMIEPDTESRGFIIVIVGAALLVQLARSVLRLHDELEGGTVIDARGDELLIERNAELPGDIIIIVDSEGAKMHERSALPSPEALAKLLAK